MSKSVRPRRPLTVRRAFGRGELSREERPVPRTVEEERDVLRHLLSTTAGAFVLWDPNLRVVWISPEAEACLESALPGDALERAAAVASRQTAPEKCERIPTSRRRGVFKLLSASGKPLSVEFVSIGPSDACSWLVAELNRDHDLREKLAGLTRAEREVLDLLVRGGSNQELARQLCVSVETIRTHVSRILGKLGVSTRGKAASLIRYSELRALI